MDVYLASPRGFCAGVDLAVDIVALAIEKYGAPVYVKHQIVHNPMVVADVESKGAITVDEVTEVPKNSVVVFSAHGSPPSDYEIARSRGLTVLDATCPLVTRVHNEAARYHNEGRKIVLVGHRGHAEVRGTMGQAPMTLLDDRENEEVHRWDEGTEIAVLTQTTLSVDDTARAIGKIKQVYPDAIIRNDVCYATTNRQDAVKKLADQVDMVLVIGSDNSSNCNQLREVAESKGVPAYLINSAAEVNESWIAGISKVGITSGASTPEVLVDEVITKLRPDTVSTLKGVDEDVTFVLPKEMRKS